MRLSHVDAGRLLGLKYKLICNFKLAVDLVGGGNQEFVNDTEGPEFLENVLMGTGR